MKLFNFILVLFNVLFGWWIERRKRRAEERRKLEKYRQQVGKFIGCMSAVRPIRHVAGRSFWWKPPQISMSEERERLEQLVYGYMITCVEKPWKRESRTADEEQRNRRMNLALFNLICNFEFLAESGYVDVEYYEDSDDEFDDEFDDDRESDGESGYDTDNDPDVVDDDDAKDNCDNDDDGLFYH